MTGVVLMHAATGAPGSPLARLLGEGLEPITTYRPLVGPTRPLVRRLSGPPALLHQAGSGLPDGDAHAEATAVRLRRLGVELRWGPPDALASREELFSWCRGRGTSSVQLARVDPGLVAEMQVGAWFQAGWRGRLLRRLACRSPGAAAAVRRVLRPPGLRLKLACDAAFWAGVRGAATQAEWHRLAESSYVMLVYHRLAGEGKAEQQRIDIDPGRFAAHLSVLRLLRFRYLGAEEILAFHAGGQALLPRRSVAVTLDDGFLDCRAPLLAHSSVRPQLFVCTQELGGTAHWAGDEPVMSREQVAELVAADVAVGAHARRHEPLVELGDAALEESVAGSLADLQDGLDGALEVLAYPHGAHDERVRQVTKRAGFRAAYTTDKGKNGAGTDIFCLRRIGVHARDGRLAILWKALTGEPPPRLGRRV